MMNLKNVGTWKSYTSVAVLAFGLVALTGCSSDDATAPSTTKTNPTGNGETASKKIDNATGGSVSLPNGTTVEVPAGALPDGVEEITVTSSPEPAPKEYQAESPVYQFGPEGTVFLKPIKVTIPVNIAAGVDKSQLTIMWSRANGAPGYDMLPSTFTPVSGSTTAHKATTETSHFSRVFAGRRYTTDPFPPPDPYVK